MIRHDGWRSLWITPVVLAAIAVTDLVCARTVELGDAHEASIGAYDFKLAPGARRFDLGNYKFLATAAVDASENCRA